MLMSGGHQAYEYNQMASGTAGFHKHEGEPLRGEQMESGRDRYEEDYTYSPMAKFME